MTKSLWKKFGSGKVALITFGIGIALTAILMIASGIMFMNAGEGSYKLAWGPVLFFQVTKEARGGASLTPGLGLGLLVLVFPALAGAIAYAAGRKKQKRVRSRNIRLMDKGSF